MEESYARYYGIVFRLSTFNCTLNLEHKYFYSVSFKEIERTKSVFFKRNRKTQQKMYTIREQSKYENNHLRMTNDYFASKKNVKPSIINLQAVSAVVLAKHKQK